MKHTSIRWSEPSLKMIQAEAAVQGITTSQFVREAAVARAAYLQGIREDGENATIDKIVNSIRDELGPALDGRGD